MKKLLCLCLCVFLCGCAPVQVTPTNSTIPTTLQTQPTTVATEPTEDNFEAIPYTAPLTAVSLPLFKQTDTADDGTLLFTHTYQEFFLVLNDPLVAEAILVDFLNRNDTSHVAVQNVRSAAQGMYDGPEGWTPYLYQVSYTPGRLDQTVFSLVSCYIIYDGSIRSVHTNSAVTYSTQTGRPLPLREVLNADYSADALCQLIADSLESYAAEGKLFSDYRDSISDMFAANTPTDNWYFAADGLCFFFDPYEIAPSIMGTITAKIPYSDLVGILKDEYFPAEQVEHRGAPILAAFADTDTTEFSLFAEMIMDAEAPQYLLYTAGTILQPRLEIGIWSGDVFTPEATVFVAEAITEGTAVMLQLPQEQLPRLRLTYISGGETVCVPLNS